MALNRLAGRRDLDPVEITFVERILMERQTRRDSIALVSEIMMMPHVVADWETLMTMNEMDVLFDPQSRLVEIVLFEIER